MKLWRIENPYNHLRRMTYPPKQVGVEMRRDMISP